MRIEIFNLMSAERKYDDEKDESLYSLRIPDTPAKFTIDMENAKNEFDEYITENVTEPLPIDRSDGIKSDDEIDIKEENFMLKCSFEAEKFSRNIIYGAKIEALEKKLQQVLFENHNLRRQLTKMK